MFGATYPRASLGATFMKAALASTPPTLDFIAPDEKLWPRRRDINETGREPLATPAYEPDATATTTSGHCPTARADDSRIVPPTTATGHAGHDPADDAAHAAADHTRPAADECGP